MTNIYYSPENYDLKVIDELELDEPCWSFDTFVVWRHSDGRLFYGHDSGCSCPSPFEDMTLDDLTEFSNPLDLYSVIRDKAWGDYLSDDDIHLWIAELRRTLAGTV